MERRDGWAWAVLVLCLLVPVGTVLWAAVNQDWGRVGDYAFDNIDQVYFGSGDNFQHEAEMYWLNVEKWPSTEAFYYSPLFAAGMAGLNALFSPAVISLGVCSLLLAAYLFGTFLWRRELQDITGTVIAGVIPVFVFYTARFVLGERCPGERGGWPLPAAGAGGMGGAAAKRRRYGRCGGDGGNQQAAIPGSGADCRGLGLARAGIYRKNGPHHGGGRWPDCSRWRPCLVPRRICGGRARTGCDFCPAPSGHYPYTGSDVFFTSNNSLTQQSHRLGAEELVPLVFVIQAALLLDLGWHIVQAIREGVSWQTNPRWALAFVLWGYLLVGMLAHVFMDFIAGPAVFYFLVGAGLVTTRGMKVTLAALITVFVVGPLMSFGGVIPCYLLFTVLVLPRIRRLAVAPQVKPAFSRFAQEAPVNIKFDSLT